MKTISIKKYIVSVVLALFSTVTVFAEYPPEGWTDSFTEGIEQARRENKMLLLNFTGSDWCTWCIKLESTIFSTSEFKDWSEKNMVKVFLDFPSRINLSEETMNQNQQLQRFFGVRGYPTLMLLDSNLIPLLKTGYQNMNTAEFIEHLQNDRNIDLRAPDEYLIAIKKLIEESISPTRL